MDIASGSPPSHSLCRDCLARFTLTPGARERCPLCRSPRCVSHARLDHLAIAHVDCDAFYAAVEKRDNPALADRPVIVGGGRRGVVATCCYVARIYGVRSAMPMFKALKACPNAVVIPPDMAKYARVGHQIRSLMLDLTPLVEPLSIDEAFLDLSGTARLHRASPAESLARLALRVERDIGVTVSIGLAPNKFLAKIASDLDKPRGFTVIGQEEAPEFLAPRSIAIIPGIGAVTQKRLAAEGLKTIADLQRRGFSELARLFGEEGLRLSSLCAGHDNRRVDPGRETKSVSAETTFAQDISDAQTLQAILLRLSEKVATRLRKSGMAGRIVTLKLKDAQFRTVTRARALPEPTRLCARIFANGSDLLQREAGTHAYRLIGIGVSDLSPAQGADQGDLVTGDYGRATRMEDAIEQLRDRFGSAAVERGTVFQLRRDQE